MDEYNLSERSERELDLESFMNDYMSYVKEDDVTVNDITDLTQGEIEDYLEEYLKIRDDLMEQMRPLLLGYLIDEYLKG